MKATAAAKDTPAVAAAAAPKQKKAAACAATACAPGEGQPKDTAAVAAAATPKEKQAAAATQRKKLLEPTPKKRSLVEPEPPTPYPKPIVVVEWSRERVQARVGGSVIFVPRLFSRRVVNEDTPLSTGVYSCALYAPSHPDSDNIA